MGGTRKDLIETERLILEPIEPRHAEGIFDATVSSQPELLPWMPWAREPTLEGVREMIADGLDTFAIIDRTTGEVVGVAGLNPMEDGSHELHYWIRSDHARRGLATEASRAVLQWGRQSLGVTRFTLWAGRENKASRRVAEKLGFAHIGPLDWRPNGGLGEFDAESYELVFL